MGITQIFELLKSTPGREWMEDEMAAKLRLSTVAVHHSMKTVITYEEIQAVYKHNDRLIVRRRKAWHYAYIKTKTEG